MSKAAAVNWAGDALVELGAGEQMFTVRSTVAVHPLPPFVTATLALAFLLESALLVAVTWWLPAAAGAA